MTQSRRLARPLALFVGLSLAATACRSGPPELPVTPGESVFYTFEKFAPGTCPPTWAESAAAEAANASASSASAAGAWRVEDVGKAASGARALVHGGATARSAAPVWIRGAQYSNVKINAMARCQESADFSVVWRVANEKNFLAFRVNTTRNSLTLERVVNGVASELAKTTYPFEANRWASLSIEHAGDRVQCGVAGAILLETTVSDAPPRGSAGFCQYPNGSKVEFDNLAVIGERP
jgi:hypothetical protein